MKALFLLVTLLIGSASLQAQDSLSTVQIAPEFSTFKGTLLVIRNKTFRDNTLNRMTEKRLEKHYKGEYEIIDEEDLSAKAYSNPAKYRFTVQLLVGRTVTRGGMNAGDANDNSRFVMVDRLKNVQYQSRNYSNWVNAMNQYIKALEEARSKE